MTSPYCPSIRHTLIRWLYTLLITLVTSPRILQVMIRQLISSGASPRHKARIGWLSCPVSPGGILFHCVSVGEVVAASRLVRQLLAEHPDMPVTITTTTQTGAERVAQLFADRVRHCYLPYDLPWAMAKLLNQVSPAKVIITEVELWPNMLQQCWKRDIPVYIINARMTDKSCHAYQRFSGLFKPMLQQIEKVCAQGQRDYDNYLTLGMEKDRLILTRNIKFDLPVQKSVAGTLQEKYNPLERPMILAGSTHEPEEQSMLDAYRTLLPDHPKLLLVIVPRHPQRFDKVWELCQMSGLTCGRSSQGRHPDANVLLVDEMGVLADLYAMSSMAFVGGSLANRGGHNALEAAACATPALMGPHTYNNPEICELLAAAGALVIVEGTQHLTRQLALWLAEPEHAKRAGAAGLNVVTENTGAVERTLRAIFETS